MQLKRKLGLTLYLIGFLVLLVGCGGKINYQGEWYGALPNNEEVKITISKDTYTIQGDTEEKKSVLAYQQTGQGFENKTRYVLLKIKGEAYTLSFPTGKEADGAVLIKTSDKDEPLYGNAVHVMSREDYPDYQEYIDTYLEQ
ncbi:hypothetical protein [Isobaculum melis]|uniref:Lipoprotein n=1 Tax=Isobaculum melis TaxID=142588 RepID=A0A1H9PXL8_9LACT|nr:hypothetical protein [Isobaculum melis]SER52868.1 hypothetical protein SAMN04488559_101212 [Isobaculum melis]